MNFNFSKDQRKQIATIFTAIASILLSAVLATYFNAKIDSEALAYLLVAIFIIYGASIIVVRRKKHVKPIQKSS